MENQDPAAELDPDERLFAAVVHGRAVDHAGLLEGLADVNGVNWKGRTLLHVASRVGKHHWVDALLRRGADPHIPDGTDGQTVVEVAENMLAKYPDDEGREKVLKLLRFVSERERAKAASLGGLNEHTKGPDGNEVGTDPHRGTLTTGAGILQVLSATSESIVALRREVGELREWMVSAIGGLTLGLSARDILLEKLEESVTMLADEFRATVQPTGETSHPASPADVVEGGEESVGASRECRTVPVSLSDPEGRVRSHCIDSLLHRTELVRRTEETTARVRGFYEALYSLGPSTSWILRYLQTQPDFQAVVNCDVYYASNIMGDFQDLAGLRKRGPGTCAYACMSQKVVYLGGCTSPNWPPERVAGYFIMSLAQMSAFLAFRNDGRPYAEGEDEQAMQYQTAIEDMMGGWSEEDREFDPGIKRWLQSQSKLEREICMVSAVPGMIATFGLLDGMLRAHRKMRRLTEFYEDHFIATLSRECGNSMEQEGRCHN